MSRPSFREISETCKRFRILCVGRSGVGKSSLINEILGISRAKVEHNKPGEADIENEFSSHKNESFVLHDSKGFEPGDNDTFIRAKIFISQRSMEQLESKDRLHAIWVCSQTPTAGGRVLEQGDEKILQLAHEKKIPVVIVFTQYDQLVRSKVMELRDKKHVTGKEAEEQAVKEAHESFKHSIECLEILVKQLNIPLPKYVKVSVRPGYKGDVSELLAVFDTLTINSNVIHGTRNERASQD